jgi:hypothetical protein
VPDALPHQPIKLNMLVPYSAARSTESLNAATVVLLRPDLAVERVEAPSEANIRQVANIPAYIRELNGDLGATADVFLMEGDTVLDTAFAVSVPAHASMAVVFSTVFQTAGTHALKVVVTNVSPGDYDLSNNEGAASVDIVVPPLESVYYYLNYSWSQFDYHSQSSNPYSISVYDNAGKEESLDQTLSIPVGLEFPINSIRIQVRSDGSTNPVVDLALANIAATYSYDYGCARYDYGFVDAGNGFYVEISSYSGACAGTGYTNARVSHYAADYVTFSAYHDLIYGTDSEATYVTKSGSFIESSQQIDTTFIVSDEAGSFGGNSSTLLYAYPYDNSWDYSYDYGNGYFEHYEGHDRRTQVYGGSSGVTTP